MRLLLLGTVSGLLTLTAPADANMAQPWHEGAIGSEPVGISDVHVAREELVFDLRRSDGAEDRVDAVYELRNDGDARAIDLQFVAIGMNDASTFEVRVNGGTIDARFEGEHAVPPSWKAPETTPIPGGGELAIPRPTPEQTAPSILFTAPLSTGDNRVEVGYKLVPSVQSDAGRYSVLQTAYVLAPAREWASFGELQITVLPAIGDAIATSLPLEAQDGKLIGVFHGIPADQFTVATQHRAPLGNIWLFYCLCVGGALIVCWLATYRLVSKHPRLAGVLATLASTTASVATLWGIDSLLGTAAPGWGYAMIFVGTPIVIATGLVSGTIATVVLHRSRKQSG